MIARFDIAVKRPFSDSRRRIRWAKDDFAQFKKTGRRFFKTNPHIAVTEMDDQGVNKLDKIKLSRPLPEALERRTIGTLEHLRSALDLAAYDVATLAGVAKGKIHFPFSDTAADFKSRLHSACKDFPQDIHALFAGFKPYQGGDDLLWALNTLCNTSKHRKLVRIVMTTGPLDIQHIEANGPYHIPARDWDSEKDELIYVSAKPGIKLKYKVQMSFAVAFGEVEVVKGQPVEAVLDTLLGKVSGIVDATA